MTNPARSSIVVATDGSAGADRAVRWAAEQAMLEHRPLVVATAVRAPVLTPSTLGMEYPVAESALVDAAAAIAADGVASAVKHCPGVSARPVILEGDPRDELVTLSHDAHLLVLGSRGRGPVLSALLGSVSASVSKQAACPVVVCRPDDDEAARWGVAVGADGSLGSLPVVDFAFRQADLRSRLLTVVHTFWDFDPVVERTYRHAELSAVDESQLILAETLAGFRERYPRVQVVEEVVRGAAADTLATMAETHALVVIGRHPLATLADRLTGANSIDVLERVRTNVAVVPEEWTS